MPSVAEPQPAVPEFLALPANERHLGPFRLIRQLGHGGFAPVWLAEESYDGRRLRDVAIKLFFLPAAISRASSEAIVWRDEILDEARALCRVEHPNVVRFYSLQRDDASGVVGLVMEYVPGESLDVHLEQASRFSERAALDAVVSVAWALAAVHDAELVHRDVKPGNIIRAVSGYKLIDFGIAGATPARGSLRAPFAAARAAPLGPSQDDIATVVEAPAVLASTPAVHPTPASAPSTQRAEGMNRNGGDVLKLVGTPGYMAPECVVRGVAATPASDLYALGATLFKLMTGLVPAAAAHAIRGKKGWSSEVTYGVAPAPSLDACFRGSPPPCEALVSLTSLLLSPDPNERPHHAGWVARELEAIRASIAQPGSSSRGPRCTPVPGSIERVTQESLSAFTRGSPSTESIRALLEHERILPEPLALLCASVRRAHKRAGPEEIRGALAELGIGVLRYAFAVGLALLAAAAPTAPSASLRESIEDVQRGVGPTPSAWGHLMRALHDALAAADPLSARHLAFALDPTVADALTALSHGSPTDSAVQQGAAAALALLQAAESLLALPLCVPAGDLSGERIDVRKGSHAQSGGWSLGGFALPGVLMRGEPYVVLGNRWVRLAPWLPHEGGRLLLPEMPSAPDRPWRASDPESSERRDDPRLDQSVRVLAGEELDAPKELCRNPPLIGRADVLAVLAREAEEAKKGGVRAVLLTGPMGIGRTRLLGAGIELFGGESCRVLRMQGSPERQSPLRPLVRALDSLARAGAGGLVALREATQRALAPSVLGDAHEMAIEGVEEALLQMSAAEPTVLAFDDIQWADAHSLTLLRLLLERAGVGTAGRLLVVATARNEPNPEAPLRALLTKARAKSASGGVRHIVLGPLTPEQTAAVAQAVSPIAPDLEAAVVRGSGNVPFFVVHPLVVWRETGAIAWRRGAWRAVDQRALFEDVPGVADLIEARLASYFDPGSAPGRVALRVLACVALYGGGLGIEIILRAVGEASSAESALETLALADILTVDGDRQEYGFAQEMVRQAVLNLVRQRPWVHRLHRALLDAVAAGPSASADAAFLATGYEKLGAVEQARVWLARAMEASVGAGLFAEAAKLGDRLAALTTDQGDRTRVELDVVRALVHGREAEEARQRLDRLDTRAALIPGIPGGRALDLRRRIYHLKVARSLGAGSAADKDLVADADALGDLELRSLARMALAGVSPEESALKLVGEAVQLATHVSEALEYAARMLRCELLFQANARNLKLAESDLKKALAIATAASSTWQKLQIEGDLAVIEAESGQMDAAIDRTRRLVEQAEALGLRGQERIFLQNLSVFLLREGRAAEAAQAAGRNAELAAEAGDPMLQALSLSLRADALRRSGSLDAALAAANEAARIQEQNDDRWAALTRIRRAEIFDAQGKTEDALADAREARRIAERHSDRDLVLGARVWETMCRVRRAGAPAEELERVVAEAEASGVTLRAPTRSVIAQARRLLIERAPTMQR